MTEGYLVHASTMSTIRINSDGNPVKTCGTLQQSGILLERELKVMEALEGVNDGQFPRVISSSRENGQLSITISRVGTHDLNDAMHDISIESIPKLFIAMISGIREMHDQGFVHRDVKPGNFMINNAAREDRQEFAGIIDFGLSMRINRKQDKPGALGGTRPYSHPSQTTRDCKNFRAHPGQDWFALARTMVHLLVGGSKDSLTSMIESGSISSAVEKALSKAWKGDVPQQLKTLLNFSISPASEDVEAVQELEKMGRDCIDIKVPSFPELKKSQLTDYIRTVISPTSEISVGFQVNSKDRPMRHDILLIVDSTGSMSNEMEDLRINLGDVSKEISSKIDLRVDIWLLGDYSRDESQTDPVRVIGKRLRFDALSAAITELKAESEQLDDAEAYEAALQDAYLGDRWEPRYNSTRTIVVIGDSYAHGWLTKHYWAMFHHDRKEKKKGGYIHKYSVFMQHHPDIKKPWIWQRREEEEARKEAASAKSELDDFSSRGHVYVPSSSGKRNRPNIRNSLERCVSRKGASVHSIFAGSNLVARNFMKFVALMGEGTYTEVSQGELKLALTGLFTSPDPSLFESFSSQVQSSNPDTDVLGSITSFVIDTL